MIFRVSRLSKIKKYFVSPLKTNVNSSVVSKSCFRYFSTSLCQVEKYKDFGRNHDIDPIIAKVRGSKNENEVFQSLVNDSESSTLEITDSSVDKLLHRFQDDWKTALGVFRWVEAFSGHKPLPESYDKLVDILGKSKQMEKMNSLVEQMRESHLVSLNTIAKLMRRFTGAGDWKEAVKVFDDLEKFGLKKNTESMNLLLDTLCKEHKVEQAREIFLDLKLHIPPNAHTFNIFIHGWCKINRVEEAYWTIQEIKGHGLRPCVITYSTIIQFYCSQSNFFKVYELLDEMKLQGCPPNVVTFTTIIHSLTKSGDFKEALEISNRMKSIGCKPDVLFYNALIHTLGRAGKIEEAIDIFTSEMALNKTNPNTSTYNTMIAMFCHHRQDQRALQYLNNLENSPICKPDVQSFYPILKFYFREGKTGECLSFLVDVMVNRHHLCPDLATYTLLIHGLCRASQCEWAYRLFVDMTGQGVKPRYLTCSLLLKEIKQKNMLGEAGVIEDYVKKMKNS